MTGSVFMLRRLFLGQCTYICIVKNDQVLNKDLQCACVVRFVDESVYTYISGGSCFFFTVWSVGCIILPKAGSIMYTYITV